MNRIMSLEVLFYIIWSNLFFSLFFFFFKYMIKLIFCPKSYSKLKSRTTFAELDCSTILNFPFAFTVSLAHCC